MPQNVICAYKTLGETPLEALEKVRIVHVLPLDMPLTYAGRLDPVAEGLLIVLTGEECKHKDAYTKLDKTYEFKILVGFDTDTYDLLGIPEGISSKTNYDSTLEIMRENLPLFTGTFTQKYPRFSSKTVGGIQLFQRALDNELPEHLPEHEVMIHSLEITGSESMEKEVLLQEIIRRVSLVKGDFRQEEILKQWHKVFKDSTLKEYQIVSFIARCSSGTYIRQLVHDISQKIAAPLVTFSIKRTEVGTYTLADIRDK